MSWPQHIGDFILPCPLGHLDIDTVEPSSFVRISGSNSVPHCEQVNPFTAMPQPTVQEYVVIFSPFVCRCVKQYYQKIGEIVAN